jgi:hypothetical protein
LKVSFYHIRVLISIACICSIASCTGQSLKTPSEQRADSKVATADTVAGGSVLPARGALRIALIFARFSADDRPHPYWNEYPNPDHPRDVPDWMQQFLSETETETGTSRNFYENISNYFDVASSNALRIRGEVYHVEVPDSLKGNSHARANQFVMQELFGNFETGSSGTAALPASEYDQWQPRYLSGLKPYSEQEHIKTADGIFDYAIIVYRHQRGWKHPFNNSWNAIASLGSGRPYVLGDSTLVYGSGRRTSGSTALFMNPAQAADHIFHEMAHHLLGAAHPYQGNTGEHPAYWGLFNSYLANQSVNGWERERLGWADMSYLRGDKAENDESDDELITLEMEDFMSGGNAVAYPVNSQGTDQKQLMIFEFRNKTQRTRGVRETYDMASLHPDDRGLFVYTIDPPYTTRTQDIVSLPADGHHIWEVNNWNEACGEANWQPVLQKKDPHPLGISYRDVFVISSETRPDAAPADSLYSLFVSDMAPEECRTYTFGQHHATAFGPASHALSGKRWFSAYTNPGSLLQNGQYAGISFYIHEIRDGKMRVSFSEDPFLDGLNEPLRISQDVFLYDVPRPGTEKTSDRAFILIPEGTELMLEQGARLYIQSGAEIQIDGKIVTTEGNEIRGRHTIGSLRVHDGLPVSELPELPSFPRKATY